MGCRKQKISRKVVVVSLWLNMSSSISNSVSKKIVISNDLYVIEEVLIII